MRLLLFLFESSCIAASSAKRFCGLPVLKAVVDCFCPIRVQNFLQIGFQQITQCQITLMIQTAGDHGTVAKNTDLVPESVTEYLFTLVFCLQIRPVKFIAVFQIYSVSDAGALPFLNPGFREIRRHCSQNVCVSFLRTTLIPQPENHQFPAFCSFSECKTLLQICFKGHCQIICFKSMEGNVYFVQCF